MLIHSFNTQISSYQELKSLIKHIQEYRGISDFQECFRGQGRDCWNLLPKIARQKYSPEKLKTLEREIISEFYVKIETQGLIDMISLGPSRFTHESKWLLIQQAQHYRLPTRFMDWTKSWEVALYFAVSDEKDDFFDGQFWIYIIPPEFMVSANGEHGYFEKDPYEFEKTIFLNPAIYYSENAQKQIAVRRKGTQKGMFCVQPYSKVIIPLEVQSEHYKNLHKIIIPSKFKKTIREELKILGITIDAIYVLDPLNLADTDVHKKAIMELDFIVDDLCRKYNF